MVLMPLRSSSLISPRSNISSIVMLSSTTSRLSAFRSSVKLVSRLRLSASTTNCFATRSRIFS